MLPLKAFVNTLQNTLWYPDCLVRAFPFFDRGLEHQYPELVLEKPSDRFDIEFPEISHFGRCEMRSTGAGASIDSPGSPKGWPSLFGPQSRGAC
jgi:hypothetical protein